MLEIIGIVIVCLILSVPMGLFNWMVARRVVEDCDDNFPEEIMLGNVVLSMLSAPLFPITLLVYLIYALFHFEIWNIAVWQSPAIRRRLDHDYRKRFKYFWERITGRIPS